MRAERFVAAWLVLVVCGSIYANDLHVPGDYDTIQVAIDDSNDGDTVIVAPGIYTGPGNRDIDFLGKAITVRSIDPNDPNIVAATIIDCNGTEDDPHRGFYFHSGEDGNSILAGLAVTTGYGPNPPEINGHAVSSGGAIICSNSSPTISNCHLSGNYARRGGGIACFTASPTIDNCLITENGCHFGGGGIYSYQSSPLVTNCTFKQNGLDFGVGGGMCNDNSCPTVINCLFTENIAGSGGGGMSNYESEAVVEDCIFIGNQGGSRGGGITNVWGSQIITSCMFVANTAPNSCWCPGGGGAIFNAGNSAVVKNCLFSANSGWNGNVISNINTSPEINNCTFASNKNEHDGGSTIFNWFSSGNSKVTNCIFWSGGTQTLTWFYGPIDVTYSNVQGGWVGIGNVDVDPCFVNVANYYYHLLPNSPCIDTGDPNYLGGSNETDLDGNPRLLDGNKDGAARVDMGAHEYWPPIELAMTFTPQRVNCNGKGKWLKAHITLPEEIYPEDIDTNEPAIAYPMEVESESIKVLGSVAGPVKLEIGFRRETLCEGITDDGDLEITIVGYLTTGQEFEGTDAIRVKSRL